MNNTQTKPQFQAAVWAEYETVNGRNQGTIPLMVEGKDFQSVIHAVEYYNKNPFNRWHLELEGYNINIIEKSSGKTVKVLKAKINPQFTMRGSLS